jgi:superfamily II DNA/RNA helicase
MSFAELNLAEPISKALAACGYTTPTPIQAKSIPDILLGKDMVASAQTGTGKTAAFVLPALHRLATTKATHKARVLILTPTRELATQITQAVTIYGKFLRCNIVSLVGGMPYRQQLRGLARPIDIIVATPGRLLDHMSTGRLDLSAIEMLILDEADRMLDMGFIDDVTNIADATPANRQTLLFSATVDNRLSQVIRQLLKNPTRIDFSSEKLTPAKITQELYLADNQQHKMRLLMHFLKDQQIFKAIIFSATKINADRLAAELNEQGFEAAALHGDLKQNVRSRTVEQLRRGKIQFLVATDVAARGIDINDITHVFNFDLPKFSEDYVHRIGRTGRAGKTGIAISFALAQDALHVQRIERLMKQGLQRKTVEGLEPRGGSSKSKNSGRGFKSDNAKRSSGRKSDSRNFDKAKRFGKPADSEKFSKPRRSDDDFSKSKSSRFSKSSDSENFSRPKRAGSFKSDGDFAKSKTSRFGKSSDSENFSRPKRASSFKSDGDFAKSKTSRFGKSSDSENFSRPKRASSFKSDGDFTKSKSSRFGKSESFKAESKFGKPKRFSVEDGAKPASSSKITYAKSKRRDESDGFERPKRPGYKPASASHAKKTFRKSKSDYR